MGLPITHWTMLRSTSDVNHVQAHRVEDSPSDDEHNASGHEESDVEHARILASISSSPPRSVDLPPIQTQDPRSITLPSLSELNLTLDISSEHLGAHDLASRRPSIASHSSFSSASEGEQYSAGSSTYAPSEASDDTYALSQSPTRFTLSPRPHFSTPQYAASPSFNYNGNRLLAPMPPGSSLQPLPNMTHTSSPFQDALYSITRRAHPSRYSRSPIMEYPPLTLPARGIPPSRITRRTVQRRRSSPSSSDEPPKPHNNRPYEEANIDYITYKVLNEQIQWDPLEKSYNADSPRLLQYAQKCHQPEPWRTASGLQARYYRQRLDMPKRDERGDLVIEDGKVVTEECKVREEVEREDGRRLSLITLFPERVVYYGYFFVSRTDMARAKELAARDIARKQQYGIPPWRPETRPQRRPRGNSAGL